MRMGGRERGSSLPVYISVCFCVLQIEERLNGMVDLARRSLQPRSPGQPRELGKLKRKRKWKRASSKFNGTNFVKYKCFRLRLKKCS